MAMTPKEYDKMLKESSPPTRSGRSLPMAFVVGGLICVVGQALTQYYLSLGLGREEAGAWCSVTLIFLSVLTTGLGWYQRLAKYAGAGTLVPITGFANAIKGFNRQLRKVTKSKSVFPKDDNPFKMLYLWL